MNKKKKKSLFEMFLFRESVERAKNLWSLLFLKEIYIMP